MKKFFQLMALACVSAVMFNCTGLGDDDDDDSTGFLLSGGTYTVSNHSVTQDECDFAGVPGTITITVPGPTNGADAEIEPPNGIDLEHIGNNLSGFTMLDNYDWNPAFDCISDETYNYDGTLTGDDMITFTVTTFFEPDATVGGTECMAAYQDGGFNVTAMPCETIETFDLSL